jgi:hypothetical protein
MVLVSDAMCQYWTSQFLGQKLHMAARTQVWSSSCGSVERLGIPQTTGLSLFSPCKWTSWGKPHFQIFSNTPKYCTSGLFNPWKSFSVPSTPSFKILQPQVFHLHWHSELPWGYAALLPGDEWLGGFSEHDYSLIIHYNSIQKDKKGTFVNLPSMRLPFTKTSQD